VSCPVSAYLNEYNNRGHTYHFFIQTCTDELKKEKKREYDSPIMKEVEEDKVAPLFYKEHESLKCFYSRILYFTIVYD
jgi:hypothetical protein